LLDFRAFFGKVICAHDDTLAYALYVDEKPDIILANTATTTFDLIKRIRTDDQTTPIIMLSQDLNPATLLQASNASIDGYVSKSIRIDDMLALICVALKRNGYKNHINTISEDVVFNHSTKELYKNGKQIFLGSKELQLLLLLANNAGKTFSRNEIEEQIYPLQNVTDSALRNLINNLRQKLGKGMLVSVRGMGWRIKATL
jgi:two-component system, OmpR family, response regulator VanR